MKRFIFRIKKLNDNDFRVVEADTRCGIRRMSPKKCATKEIAKAYREQLKNQHRINTTKWKVIGDDFGLVGTVKTNSTI